MSAIKQPIIDWIESLKAFHIPRWSELPEMELYSDQVVSYIEKYLSDLFGNENTFITASMICRVAQKLGARAVENKILIFNIASREHLPRAITPLLLSSFCIT